MELALGKFCVVSFQYGHGIHGKTGKVSSPGQFRFQGHLTNQGTGFYVASWKSYPLHDILLDGPFIKERCFSWGS
jgi:hypothetical protein